MKITPKEMVTFAFLGALMFCSKMLTEFIPNVHFLAMFTIAYTVVFRAKALYAILTFIMITGMFYGFGTWWPMYFYLWPILWLVTMLLPKNMPVKVAVPVYMITAALHGLLYGTMCAPYQALLFGFDFERMAAWIIAGLPWDLVHGIGNAVASLLVIPVVKTLRRAMRSAENGN